MKFHHLALGSLAILVLTTAFHAGPRRESLAIYSLAHPSAETMARVAARFEVLKRTEDGFEILVPSEQASELPAEAKLVVADIREESSRADRAGYHTIQTVESELKQIATDHADLASLETYGFSEEGRPLYVLTLNGTGGESKPALLFTGATHGNELISTEVIFGQIAALLVIVHADPEYVAIGNHHADVVRFQIGHAPAMTLLAQHGDPHVDNHTLHVIPVVNPDGYSRRERYANGVDPNRDYPYPDEPARRSNAAIQGIMSFVGAHAIKGSIDYHSYGELVMYPWAYTSGAVPDRAKFEALTAKMAQATGYRHGQISRILYDAPGSSADYYYWKYGTVGVAVEIGNAFAPPASQIAGFVREQLEPTWQFIETF
jgi:carboxypeptidase T